MGTMISKNFIQEQLSLACASAVVFRAGFNLSKPEVDCGIDETIEYPSRNGERKGSDLKTKLARLNVVRGNGFYLLNPPFSAGFF